MNHLKGKRILVTGACGTVGAELTRMLLEEPEFEVAEVLGLDNNETELFFIDQRFLADDRASFTLGDIRDKEKLRSLMAGIDVVFHTAALKHVIISERAPFDAVQTNILGVQNIIEAAQSNQVEKVIFTSSDKAVNPTNVMGTSKLMGERLITAANNQRNCSTIFASTRFGNVIGSRGSVFSIFKQQIQKGGPLTITDPEMTRFIMTIEEAVRLVLDSANVAQGGEVLVTKMPVIRIMDLAEVMIELLAPEFGHDPASIEIVTVGSKPGEKLYEELMSDEETRRAQELTRYFCITPAFQSTHRTINYSYPDLVTTHVDNPYNSSNEASISKDELKAFLRNGGLI